MWGGIPKKVEEKIQPLFFYLNFFRMTSNQGGGRQNTF